MGVRPLGRERSTMSADNSVNPITQGSIVKALTGFAFPILLSNLFQQFYNLVDSIIVGRFVSAQGLAAVGSVGSLCGLVIGFFMGLATGAGVLVSQYYGAGDVKNLQKAVHTTMCLALLSGVLLTGIGLLVSPLLLEVMNTPADVLPDALTYLEIYFGGILSLTIYNMGAGILRAAGDSKRPLLYLVVSSVVNIILTLLFVVPLKMGVAGAAWGTLAAQVVSAVLVLLNLTRTEQPYRYTLRRTRIDGHCFKDILRIGIPAGLQSVVVSLSNVIIQTRINSFGSSAMAGLSAAAKIDGFVFTPMNAFGLAATTFTGQNVGANRFDRVKRGTWICLGLSMGITLVLGLLAVAFRRPLLAIINTDPEVIAYGQQMVFVMGVTYSIFAVGETLTGVIRGTGTSVPPMIITLVNMCLVRMVYIFVTKSLWPDSILAVMLCYPFSWVLNASCMLLYYFRGGWLKKARRRAETAA